MIRLLEAKVSSICDGKVCYEPTGEYWTLDPAAWQAAVPRAIPEPVTKLLPAKTTWIGEILRLLYETEMGKGRIRIPRLPPPRVPRY